MSITLITAAPGAGKTIYAVWNLIKPAIEAGRVVYTAGIPELKLPAISLSYSQVKRWADRDLIDVENPSGIPIPDDERPALLNNISEGALIVVDEVQYLWPASGSKEPGEDIKYLTKHRHHGLEFVLITQAPQLIHKNVLAVVDKHIHMLSNWHGRKRYEWPEYCSTVRATSSKLKAVTERYDLPKEAYGLYRSASIHVTQKRKKPLMVYIFPLLPIFFIYLGYHFFVKDKPSVVELAEKEEVIHHPQQQTTPTTVTTATTVTVSRPVTLALVSSEIDWSKVGACVSTEKKCICYGKSAERLVIPPETCRKAVSSGWPGQETKV